MNREHSTAILVGAVAVAAALVVGLSPRADPLCDDDSVAYIEAGRNFAQGRGFVTWPYGADDYGREFVPLKVFPPGFPFLISACVRLGAPAETAATWIPRVCFVLLPVLLYRVLRFVLPRGPALASAVVSCVLPPVVFHSLCAMSDVPFLFVVLLGFLALFRGVRLGEHRWILAAGLLAGLATDIRNAGYAVPAAVVVAFVLCRTTRPLPVYLAGFAAGYAPVVARNVLLFGRVQPYAMPRSGLSPGDVLHEGLRAFDTTFWAGVVPWPVLFSGLTLLLLVSAGWLVRSGNLRRLVAGRTPHLLAGAVLVLYAVAGTGMILLTRLAFAVDPINPRFLIQYHWVFIAWCVLLLSAGLRAVPLRSVGVRIAAGAALAVALLAAQVPVARAQIEQMRWSRAVAADHANLRDLVVALPRDTCVVAFHAPQLHLMYERPVYQMPAVSPAEASAFVGSGRSLVVLMFPFEYERFRSWWGAFDGRMPDGYREIGRSGDVIVLERPRRVS